jgi:hypothetical protein
MFLWSFCRFWYSNLFIIFTVIFWLFHILFFADRFFRWIYEDFRRMVMFFIRVFLFMVNFDLIFARRYDLLIVGGCFGCIMFIVRVLIIWHHTQQIAIFLFVVMYSRFDNFICLGLIFLIFTRLFGFFYIIWRTWWFWFNFLIGAFGCIFVYGRLLSLIGFFNFIFNFVIIFIFFFLFINIRVFLFFFNECSEFRSLYYYTNTQFRCYFPLGTSCILSIIALYFLLSLDISKIHNSVCC